MALTCRPGYYFDSKANDCRDCVNVCGVQYGGHEQLECTENCPGYGISTTVAPADDNWFIVWILLGGLAIVLICAVIIVYCIKRRCCCWSPRKPAIVTQESKEGLTSPSAYSP